MSRILLVEDYPPLARVAALGLARAGHEVVRAASVAEALAASGHFDGAVLDMDLPDGSGLDVAQELRDAGRVGVIVFHTASPDIRLRRRALAFGPAFLKSDGVDVVIAELSAMLEARRRRARVVGLAEEASTSEVSRSGTRRRTR